MKIAIDIRPMLEPQRCGVATYTSEIVKRLCETQGHDYALFCNARHRKLPTDVPRAEGTTSHRFFRYPNRLLNASIITTALPKLEHLVPDADAIYLPNLNFIATDLPTIVTVHDLSFVRYPQFFSAKQRAWHTLVRPERLIKNAAAIVAVSAHTKDDIMEIYGVPGDRIAVANPAVEERFYDVPDSESEAVRRMHQLYKPYLLYLGALEPRKNIPSIIAAFEGLEHKDIELVIAGGKGWLYEEIFARAKRSPARDRIRFLDYVPDAHKPGLYAGAEAFIYPSFYEGFGMPPLEAMAAGTPVIASASSSLGEVVGDAGLLVDPFDVIDIRNAIASVLDDPETRTTLSARGRSKARWYDWGTSARRIQNVFDRLA